MTFLPIVERELRVAARKPATYWLRFVVALVVVVLSLIQIVGNGRSNSPAVVAQELFEMLGWVVLVVCLLAGVFVTSDCLSSEKREGTAGLLFLTDLRGYDVVLGKLAATALPCVYGLFSIFPILALPLLMGGVTVGEFWRVALSLVVALFFSLAAGMAVSAMSRDPRQAMGGTLGIIVFFGGILPTFHLLADSSLNGGHIRSLHWPSPFYMLKGAFDAFYQVTDGRREFWGSLFVVTMLGLGFLSLAGTILPRSWQERSQSRVAGRGEGRWQQLRFGNPRQRAAARGRMLADNPCLWLTARDRRAAMSYGLLSLLCFCVCLPLDLFGLGGGSARFDMLRASFFITVGAGLLFKCLMAMEAGRWLNNDRNSGALELLLVTPVAVPQVLSALWRGLLRSFVFPFLMQLLLYAAALVAENLYYHRLKHGPGSKAYVNYEDLIIWIGNMVVWVTDLLALACVGALAGLRSRDLRRAVLCTLATVMLPPYLGLLLLIVAGPAGAAFNENLVVGGWFAFGVAVDCYVARRALGELRRHFRVWAAGAGLRSKPVPLQSWTGEQLVS
jgi:ABC-type transport system involved in cytochrome c biogenesis permease component